MPSLIYSQEDLMASDFLVNLTVDAVKVAWNEKLSCGKSNLEDSQFLNVFPGEHYRILSALVHVTRATSVVEIGTFTGMGSLALRNGLNGNGKVYTYDIIKWDKFGARSHLTEADFNDGCVEQIIGDLASDDFFVTNYEILNQADLIFMDAPKDGVFEYKMLEQLSKLEQKPNKLLVLDDIRFVNMIDFWRSISSPKLDVTPFGHWSGTGLVDISNGLTYVEKIAE
jgi:hypothetical protein